MTEWLLKASLLILCFGAVRLLGHRWLLARLGATSLYSLWLVLPILVLAVTLPQNWWPLSDLASSWRLVVTTQQELVGLATQANAAGLSTIWTVGFVAALVTFVLRWPRVRRYWRSGQLRVARTAAGNSPALTGILRPTLLLPRDFSQRFDAQQRHLILQHEQQHWRRGDTVVNVLAYLFCLIFWFHPVAWLCYRRFRIDQELACDALVLAQVSPLQRVRYGQTLLMVAATASKGTHYDPYVYRYGAKQAMKERIQQLNLMKPMRYWPLLTASLVGLTLLSAWHSPALATDKEQKAASPIVQVSPSYPAEAAAKGVEGEVTMRFNIDAEGKVNDIEVIESRPVGVFDEAAIAALKKWRYHPDVAGNGHQVALAFQLTKN